MLSELVDIKVSSVINRPFSAVNGNFNRVPVFYRHLARWLLLAIADIDVQQHNIH